MLENARVPVLGFAAFSGTGKTTLLVKLLPLLRHSDACAFRRNLSIEHWNLNEFKSFHQRARAVLKQRIATSRIAEHV